jgi:hypothetical protein
VTAAAKCEIADGSLLSTIWAWPGGQKASPRYLIEARGLDPLGHY